MHTGNERIQRFLALSALYFRLTEEPATKITTDAELEKILKAMHYYAPPMSPDTLEVTNT
ncbi:MAG: hypothetical protein HW411_1006 [Gammaproteobacteria bacterium]|nr:hypothetical protein [Gammaproteobacteria bacterium]